MLEDSEKIQDITSRAKFVLALKAFIDSIEHRDYIEK